MRRVNGRLRVGYTEVAMTDPQSARQYRFGTFEVDLGTGELRRQGIRVKLNAQPFQVLCMLLERSGELLTREEIARRLWPDGTFVDYEHGVTSAVNRIREALGDVASNPRFVETLARRGYRFVAPIEGVPKAEVLAGEAAPAEQLDPPEPAAEASVLQRRGFGVLSSPEELPKASHAVVQTLFVLFQVMYLSFYVSSLANLTEIQDLFSVLPDASMLWELLVATAAALIPVRAFLLCAVLFHAPLFREKFLKLWWFLLAMDEVWALSPFLLLRHINLGVVLSCTALLVYSPFVQRSLVLMGAGGLREARSASLS